MTGRVCLAIHPRAVSISIGESHIGARNQWPGRVVDIANLGERVRVGIDGPVRIVAEVTQGAIADLDLAPG